MMNPNSIQMIPVQQKGAVLIVALMLLVVLTLLGMSAIESTKLETKMALNTRYHNLAFQNAEAGIAKAFQKYEQAGELEQLNALLKAPADTEENNFKKVPVAGQVQQGQYSVRMLEGGTRKDPGQSRDLLVYFIESTGKAFKTDIKLYAGMTIDIPKSDIVVTSGQEGGSSGAQGSAPPETTVPSGTGE